jgi:ribonuclease HII
MSDNKIIEDEKVAVSDKEEDKDSSNIVITPKKIKNKKVTEKPVIKAVIKSNKNESSKLSLSLNRWFNDDKSIVELGIDEAGRGPMFGRVYAGVVVLPKDDSFDHSLMKDSKKFHSKKKIEQVAEYIKEKALAWTVEYEDEDVIDKINILQATQSAFTKGIKNILKQLPDIKNENILLLVDGNYFKPYTTLNNSKTKLETLKYQTIEGGDNKYTSIAAASILAKVERDKYIEELCSKNPEIIDRYGIDSNKGYGSKKHMDGIKQYGITKWHRKTFGICKEFT